MGYISDTINSLIGGGSSEYNPLSYATYIRDRMMFQRAGGLSGNDFSQMDTPGHFFFKILFYFQNGDSSGSQGLSGGLLAPTWEEMEASGSTEYYSRNSAWSFLKMNYENERAELLKKFVMLLSNISSEAPWYFTSIQGLAGALKRDAVMEENMTLKAEKKTIQIKCLPDAYDTRIGTLLDLYRTIVWSWTRKCEILPRNLRKFDMGIYIFSSPIANLHPADETVLNADSNTYSTSYKLIELHGCEIDYNSAASQADELSNGEGAKQEYTITIRFDDAYEVRWNEGMMRLMGDIIALDTASRIYSDAEVATSMTAYTGIDAIDAANLAQNALQIGQGRRESVGQQDVSSKAAELYDRLNAYHGGLLKNMTEQLIGEIKGAVGDMVNGVVLGNLHGFSLNRIGEQIGSALDGQLIQTIQAAGDYARASEQGVGLTGGQALSQAKQIFKSVTGDAFSTASEIIDVTEAVHGRRAEPSLGRIFNAAQAASIADNI